MTRGETSYSTPSRFLSELPRPLIAEEKASELDIYEEGRKARGGGRSPFSPRDSFSGRIGASAASASGRSSQSSSASGLSGKSLLSANPYITKGFGSKSDAPVDYTVGDTVTHIKFGKGVVKSMTPKGKDFEVVVEFEGENVGIRKMISSFAKLKKV